MFDVHKRKDDELICISRPMYKLVVNDVVRRISVNVNATKKMLIKMKGVIISFYSSLIDLILFVMNNISNIDDIFHSLVMVLIPLNFEHIFHFTNKDSQTNNIRSTNTIASIRP